MPTGVYIRTKPVWNKGTKGIMKSNKTSFKKGSSGFTGKHSEKTKKILSEQRKGKPFCGTIFNWKGKHLSKKHKENLSRSMQGMNKGKYVGEKSWNWRGSNIGYSGIHQWIRKILGKPTKCEHCGKDGLTGHQIHWANLSGEYKRNVTDWKRLCVPCHQELDGVILIPRMGCVKE